MRPVRAHRSQTRWVTRFMPVFLAAVFGLATYTTAKRVSGMFSGVVFHHLQFPLRTPAPCPCVMSPSMFTFGPYKSGPTGYVELLYAHLTRSFSH